jgi:hypothetical protein
VPAHELKTWPEQFQAVMDGNKCHEVRSTQDRTFGVGHLVTLREYRPEADGVLAAGYTGREFTTRITWVTQPGTFGLPPDVAVLSLELTRADGAERWPEGFGHPRDWAQVLPYGMPAVDQRRRLEAENAATAAALEGVRPLTGPAAGSARPHRSYTGWWLLLGAAAVALELVAIGRRAPGDTLSEHVWRWLWSWPGALVYVLAGWAFLYHFPRGFGRRLDHWDALAACVGLIYWAAARYYGARL